MVDFLLCHGMYGTVVFTQPVTASTANDNVDDDGYMDNDDMSNDGSYCSMEWGYHIIRGYLQLFANQQKVSCKLRGLSLKASFMP